MSKSNTIQMKYRPGKSYIIEKNYTDDIFHIKITDGVLITNQIWGTKEDWDWIKKALDKLYMEG